MDKFEPHEAQMIAKELTKLIPNAIVRSLAAPHVAKFIEDAYALGFHIGADDRATAINNLREKIRK